MAEFSELVQALTWLLTNRVQQKIDYIHGLLGDGNGRVRVSTVPGSPEVDFVYVRPDRFSDRTFKVFNKRIEGQDGDPVIIGELPWEPGLVQVVDMDWAAYADVGWGDDVTTTNRHGNSHQWRDGAPGIDTFNVYRRQFGDLKTYPAVSGTLNVGVSPYSLDLYGKQYQWPGTQNFDLSGALPTTTGTARMAMVYWSPASGTTQGYLGVATGTLGGDAEAIILNRPATPEGAIPSAFVKLRGGQSSITEFDIWDAREPFRPGILFGTGTAGLSADMIPISDTSGLYTGSTVEAALDEIGFDGARVSRVYQNDFGAVALQADAVGGLAVQGTGTFSIPLNLSHVGDPDTYIQYTDDQVDIIAGAITMLRADEAAQDVLTLGDVEQSGDVDINLFGDHLIVQPTTDTTTALQVLDADGGEPAFQVNTVDNTASIATSDISFVAAGVTTKTGLFIESPDQGSFHGFTLSKSSDTVGRHTAVSILRASASGGAVSNGWFVASILFSAHDGTDYNFSSGIRATIQGAVSANTVPGRLQFLTTTTNSLVSRINIDPDGTVKIGPVGVPSGQLHIDQSDGSGAIPALFIDQGDTSQAAITVSSDGSDQDITIVEVNVGGTPTNIWDESLDAFSWNKALNVTAGNSTFGWSTDKLRLSVADTGTNASQLTPTQFLPSGNAISESVFGIVNENAAGNIAGMAWQVRTSSAAGAFLSLERTANFQGDMVLQIRDASGTAPEIMRWRHTGNVSIGPTTPTARLHVDQDVSGGGNAVPVILLDQADLSEEFINFVATVGAGNPIDTAAIGTYYGKARVAVNGTFKYIALYNS